MIEVRISDALGCGMFPEKTDFSADSKNLGKKVHDCCG